MIIASMAFMVWGAHGYPRFMRIYPSDVLHRSSPGMDDVLSLAHYPLMNICGQRLAIERMEWR